MLDFFNFHKSVAVAQLINDQHVCVACKHTRENACVICEFYFIVVWNEDGYSSAVGSPKIVLAVARRKVNHTSGCIYVDEVFSDDLVHKRMLGFQFCLLGNYV